MLALVERLQHDRDVCSDAIWCRLALGLHHERQHQELILTDIKLSFFANPLLPVYRPLQQVDVLSGSPAAIDGEMAAGWRNYVGGHCTLGVDDEGVVGDIHFDAFHFDNESPAHTQSLQPFALADRLVTNAEYLAFIDDGGYQ